MLAGVNLYKIGVAMHSLTYDWADFRFALRAASNKRLSGSTLGRPSKSSQGVRRSEAARPCSWGPGRTRTLRGS